MQRLTGMSGYFTAAALALACCSLQSATLPAAASMHPVVAGGFALQDPDLLAGDTIGYRPWFDPLNWQGDLVEYTLTTAGDMLTDVETGASPPAGGSAGGCHRAAAGCWSARAAFHAHGADDPYSRYWQERNIFTANNGQVDFSWDRLSPDQQLRIDGVAATQPVSRQGAWDSDTLNYIRGERLHEQQHAVLPGSAGLFRSRASVLGDIDSTPVYIGPPRELLGHVADYDAFAFTHRNRPGRVAVGANDGMLHVFDAADGTEAYAYIPSMLLDKLGRLTGHPSPWQHQDLVAGGLTVASVEAGRSGWRTLLVGGGGRGFAGLYGLDVTNPAFTHDKLLFEKSGGAWGHVAGQARVGRIGGQSGNPAWYVISGNGYHTSPRHPAALMLIDLDTLDETAITLPGVSGGLSAPVLLSIDENDTVDLVFAGDTNGDLWMFEIDATDPGNSSATRIYNGTPLRPVIHAPAIAKHPSAPGYLVYFAGTPLPGSGTSGTVLAIWINTADAVALQSALPYTNNSLLTRSLTGVTAGTTTPVRITTDHSPVLYRCPAGVHPCPAVHKGWRMRLPGCGEQLAGAPRVRAGRLQFMTSTAGPACTGGRQAAGNWMMSLDYVQGHDNGRVVYDLNNDNTIDNHDVIRLSGSDKIPVGIHIGPGLVSPPVHVRASADTDRIIFNRLLPLTAVNPVPGTAGGHNGPGYQPPHSVDANKPVLPNTLPTLLQPVTLPVPGPDTRTGRRSWIDIVD